MLKKVVRAGLILGVCLEVHGQPASQTYTFCQEGFSEGAFISGSFTGADSDSNGQLESTRLPTRRSPFLATQRLALSASPLLTFLGLYTT